MSSENEELSEFTLATNAGIQLWYPITPESFSILRVPCVGFVAKVGGQVYFVGYHPFGADSGPEIAHVGDVLYQTFDYVWHHKTYKEFEKLINRHIVENV